MSSFGKSWDAMEGATLTAVGLKPDTFSRFNEVLSTVDFLPLLALSLWHTDLIVIPPFTRAFALTSLAAACYPDLLNRANFKGPVGTYLHNVVGDLFIHSSSLDTFFCTLSFVYKGIILEARMGTRRFFNLFFLLAACIGTTKFIATRLNFPFEGGMYPLLISLKVVINYTCLFHHPTRFPLLHPFLTRRLRFCEFFIALVRTRSPQDIFLGAATGTALIAGLNNPKSFIHPLLGEDGSKAATVPATKMIFRGRSGGFYRWARTVTPNLVSTLWLGTVVVCYTIDQDRPGFFQPVMALETFDPTLPISWLVPTLGAMSLTHLFYLMFLVYRTPATFTSSFKDINAAGFCFFVLLPLSRFFGMMLINAANDCSILSLWCVDFTKQFSDSCSALLAASTFAEFIAVTPETTGIMLTKLGLELAMIWKFFPEIHPLATVGAYMAGSMLAIVSLLVDHSRVFLADLPKGARKPDVVLMKNPRRQVGSVTESTLSSTESANTTPGEGAERHKQPPAQMCQNRLVNLPVTFTKQENLKKLNIRRVPGEKGARAPPKEVREASSEKSNASSSEKGSEQDTNLEKNNAVKRKEKPGHPAVDVKA